ncbi:MAG: hypothetical protein HUJ61_05590 [Bacilli bacterium]|nr:hypothetical protein [Bacilli bacterium]
MKNFLKSVLLSLLLGVIYVSILALIIAPLLFLFKEGFIGLMTGTVNLNDFIPNVLGRKHGIPYMLDPYSLTIIVIQIILFLVVCITAYIFLSKVLKDLLIGEGEEYFQMFYKIIYIIILFVPEILIIMSLFFKFPVMLTIIIVSGIGTLLSTFAFIITGRVLPDVIKNRNSKYILEGEKNEKN